MVLYRDILEGMCVGVRGIVLIISRVSDISIIVRFFKEKNINLKKDCYKKD